MPREPRECSVIDCSRAHFGHGYCRHHYWLKIEKPQRAASRTGSDGYLARSDTDRAVL